MSRPVSYGAFTSLRVALFSIGIAAVTCSPSLLLAVGLNYVDANDFTNLTPAAAIDSFGTMAAPDNLWDIRTDFGLGLTVFEAIGEDVPQLTQKISGLTPGKNYDVYGVFTTDDDENWTLRAGLTPGNLTAYSFWGNRGAFPTINTPTTQGITAGAAVWDTLPPANKEGTFFTERPADTLVTLLGKAGTIAANASGEIDVLIDDFPNVAPNTGPHRSWLDGVAYTDAGTQIALTATLDRTTGVVTVTNPTTTPFQFKGYSLASNSGSLDAAGWTKVAGWTTTGTPSDTSAFATDLTQVDPAMTGMTIAANGGTISFGSVRQDTPFAEDILVRLTRNDNELAVIAPQYTGAVVTFTVGDFDTSGAINLGDFQTLLNNLHTDQTTLSPAGAHNRGDMNGDRIINFSDFAAFRTAYDAANGAGAFAKLVPEPSTLASLVIVSVAALIGTRRRAARAAAILLLCAMANTSSATTFLKVDVDARLGDSTAGPAGANTVDGFMPFTLNAGTTGLQPTATGTVGGYNIMLTAVLADGTPVTAGGLDDRDRAIPDTAPTLNQLYDDFIFANVSAAPTGTGENGGLDMSISGGALVPNTQYNVSIYSYDTSSTNPVRTANWLDGNSENALSFVTTFDGAVNRPTTDNQYKFSGVFKTDPTGRLLLRARETATASHGVFINGFEISDELPVELTLQVNTTTGAVSIVNQQAVSFDVSYYEIRSAAGAQSGRLDKPRRRRGRRPRRHRMG